MKILLALGLSFLRSSVLGQDSPCNAYAVNDCLQDPDAEIIAFNTGTQLKCQQHCEIEEECQFYSFHKRPSQNVDCHLFREPFKVYLGHCNVRTGPLDQDPQNNECLIPEENSCGVQQHENCNLWGTVLETCLDSPNDITCMALCKVNQGEGCKYWEWNRESQCCNLYDSADKQCNIAFGPREGTPGDCGQSTDKPPTTTTGSTAKPGTCDIECPPEGLALFPDCDNCNQFYECYNGVLTSKRCENCYHFDEEKQYCNQVSQVDCGTRPPEEDCHAVTKDGDCPYDWGYFKDVHNCGRYIVCEDGLPDYKSCSNGSFTGLYDYNLEWCNWPEKVDCEDRPICKGDGGSPDDYHHCQCQGADPAPDDVCKGSGSTPEVFIDPFNCQHLIVCQNGAMSQEAFCNDGTYGNDQTGNCVADDSSVCNGRPICRNKKESKDCYCA